MPLRRMWTLLLAAFLLFSVIGYYTDLLNDGNTPYAVVFLVAAYSGLNACAWLYASSRFPVVVIVPLALLQFFNGRLIGALSHWLISRFHLAWVPTLRGVHFAATAIFVSIIGSYSLFIRFIRSEGQEAIRLQGELELAHDMHKTLVPPVHLHPPHFEVYGISHPSERVGGDLVDAVTLPGGATVAYLADISGHGLPASILMGRVKTATRSALLDCDTADPGAMLSTLLGRLNTVLPQVKEPQLYATFTSFLLQTDGTAAFALAASPPLLLWRAAQGRVEELGQPQLPIGLLPVACFESEHLALAPGDLLAVVTDGLLEVENKSGEEFGVAHLRTLVADSAHVALPQLAASILAAVRAWGRQIDDQTLLLIRRQ